MKRFDLEEALNGAKVCTRDGKDARILCHDRKGGYPIIALITFDDGTESIETYLTSGMKPYSNGDSPYDLMIADSTNVLEKYDTYEFEPFEKVLVRDCVDDSYWSCTFFSHMSGGRFVCCGMHWDYCIPYNEETKHLLGTRKEEL